MKIDLSKKITEYARKILIVILIIQMCLISIVANSVMAKSYDMLSDEEKREAWTKISQQEGQYWNQSQVLTWDWVGLNREEILGRDPITIQNADIIVLLKVSQIIGIENDDFNKMYNDYEDKDNRCKYSLDRLCCTKIQ